MNSEIKKHFISYSKKAKELRLARIQAQLVCDDTSREEKKKLRDNEEALQIAKNEEKSFRETYAEEIFKYCNDKKPMLIRRKDNLKTSWHDAFGSDYSKLSPELKESVIALVEEDGGQYRFAKSFLNLFFF